MRLNDADETSSSVDPDQTAGSSLVWVYTVYSSLPVPILRILGTCESSTVSHSPPMPPVGC